MSDKEFVRLLNNWYQQNRRQLPWRMTEDPYRIWLSEIILQQTRVGQGLPYYERFIEAFPTVEALAGAREQQVLRLWQGLGYYSRARNLHRCAKAIVNDHGGKFPTDFESLLTLPGIGPYTAAAIASIAFGRKTAVVDGNVFRVLARIYGIDLDITTPAAKKHFTNLANELIPERNPGDFNQAMMEFGAIHCTPRNPKCDTCPFSRSCVALKQDLVDVLPVKKKKAKSRIRHITYLVFISGSKIAMKKRSKGDIWEGLYDFHQVESPRATSIKKIFSADPMLKKLDLAPDLKVEHAKHILTHQTLHLRFVKIHLDEKSLKVASLVLKSLEFYSPARVARLPRPRAVTRWMEATEF